VVHKCGHRKYLSFCYLLLIIYPSQRYPVNYFSNIISILQRNWIPQCARFCSRIARLPFQTLADAPTELHGLSAIQPYPNGPSDYQFIASAGSDSIIYVEENSPILISHAELRHAAADVDGFILPKPGVSKPAELFPPQVSLDQEHATMVSIFAPFQSCHWHASGAYTVTI
jgi:hypothetical protein